ncbi:META domain-containing protein [Bacteroidia bacterium]|nr:META domain-containing protein [Bacteroidia bacterium]
MFVVEKRVVENNGRNQIFGRIDTLTATELKFGMLASTKIPFSDMGVADAFGKALGIVEQYVVQDLTLTLQDKDHNELMVLRKVD